MWKDEPCTQDDYNEGKKNEIKYIYEMASKMANEEIPNANKKYLKNKTKDIICEIINFNRLSYKFLDFGEYLK